MKSSEIKKLFMYHKPKYFAFDTETTGLNLLKDKAFLIVIGWKYNEEYYIYTLEPNKEVCNLFQYMLENSIAFAFNTKFDMHMLQNTFPYVDLWNKENLNLADAMILFHLSLPTDNIESLALKKISKKYIDNNADIYEKRIKEQLHFINVNNRNLLNTLLKPFKFNNKKINDIKNNPLKDLENEIPEEVLNIYNMWLETYGEATYNQIDLSIVKEYAYKDVEYTLKIIEMFLPKVKELNQMEVFYRECKCIIPFYNQERIGLKVDIDYLNKSINNMRDYYNKINLEFNNIITSIDNNIKIEISAQQHKFIKDFIYKHWNINLPFVDKESLNNFVKIKDIPTLCIKFVSLIIELRNINKWLTTYLVGIKNKLINGRLHESIFQLTSTGRISSSLQQFPKEAIISKDNIELFHPRKLFIPDKDYYLFFFDESQHELRIQANYTHYVGHPDINLTRAYIPYGLKNWTPIDLHSLTTITAFGEDIVNTPQFKLLRNYGKTINFAIIYGSGLKGLKKRMKANLSEQQITKLYEAFKKSFEGIKKYQEWIKQEIINNNCVKNLYNRYYYLNNPDNFYKLFNYLIQGTAADMIKEATIKIFNYLKPYKSDIFLEIHDEVQVRVHKDELFLVPKIKEMLEPKETWSIIPFVCSVEYTKTNWKDKQEWK